MLPLLAMIAGVAKNSELSMSKERKYEGPMAPPLGSTNSGGGSSIARRLAELSKPKEEDSKTPGSQFFGS